MFKRNTRTLVSSVLSIVISLVLVINMVLMISNSEAISRQAMEDLYGGTDILLYQDTGHPLGGDLLTDVENLVGVRQIARQAQAYEPDLGLDLIGLESKTLNLDYYGLKTPPKEGQVLVSHQLAEALNLKTGDPLQVRGKDLILQGVLPTLKTGNQAVFLTYKDFLTVTGLEGEGHSLRIDLEDDLVPYQVADSILALNSNLRAEVFAEDDKTVENRGLLSGFIWVISGLALVMCSLFLQSVFQTYTLKNMGDIASIRGMGGTSKQAFHFVFIQSLILGLIGCSLGYLAAYGFYDRLQTWLLNQVYGRNLTLGFDFLRAGLLTLVFFFLIQLMLFRPAVKTSRILPHQIQGMTNEQAGRLKSRTRKGWSYFFLFMTLWFLLQGFVFTYQGKEGLTYGLYACLAFILWTMTYSPILLQKCLKGLEGIFQSRRGATIYIGLQNMRPQIKRSGVIIMAISLLISLSVVFDTLASTINDNGQVWIETQYLTDLKVDVRDSGSHDYNSNILKAFYELEASQVVHTFSLHSRVNSDQIKADDSLSIRYGDLDLLRNQGWIKDWDSNSLVMTKRALEETGLKEGEELTLYQFNGSHKRVGEKTYKILLLESSHNFFNPTDLILDWSALTEGQSFASLEEVFLRTDNLDLAYEELRDLQRIYPQISWSTYEEEMALAEDMFFQRWLIFIVFIGAIFVGLVLGTHNIMVANMTKKRRDYAILRTLRMTRWGLVGLILTEVLIFSGLGLIIGSLHGTILTNLLLLTESNQVSFIHLSFPLKVGLGFVACNMLFFVPYSLHLSRRNINQELFSDQ